MLNTLNSEPYSVIDPLNEETLLQIYNLIRDNEVEHLEQLLQSLKVQGVAHLMFDFFQEDEEVINLADGSRINVSLLNPILLCVKHKSFSSLKYLIENFDLRQSLKELDLIIRHESGVDLSFRSLVLAILLKIKDNEALSFLTR